VRFLIGDPTPLGWMVTLGYLLAAVLSWNAARRGCLQPGNRVLWRGLACGTGFLGLNKQLDLQVWLNQLGRRLAIELGWYEHRFPIQLAFLLCLTGVIVTAVLFLARLGRPWSPTTKAAFGGAGILGLHLVLRAAAFDVYDVRQMIGGWNPFPAMELAGGAIIAGAALAERVRQGSGA
jgi:hypothetical protein